MKLRSQFSFLSFVAYVVIFAACSPGSTDAPTPPPANIKAVQDFVKVKKLVTKKLGFYGSLTVNGVKEIAWIDVANEKDKMTKEVADEEMRFGLQFLNDSTVTVLKKNKAYIGSYTVDDITDEFFKEEPGIKLRVSFADPDMTDIGGQAMSKVTYSFLVMGLNDKQILLQTPRSINNKKLISLLSE